ncbi:MAG: response regulator [Nibricoccus sp.]
MTRILVVDDDDAVRAVLKLTLRREGYEVLEASSGFMAVDVVGKSVVDLVLLDVEMPGMNGLAFCAELRANPAFASLPVIMMTGRPVDGVQERAHQVGAVEFVHKPFERATLLALIKTLLANDKSC